MGELKRTRAGAVEGISWRISLEGGPPVARAKPFIATYVGDDVVSIAGVGLFQHGTQAEADAETAALLRERTDFRVEPRPKRRSADVGPPEPQEDSA